MPRLTWKDGDTHQFVVISKVATKKHWNNRAKTYVVCTGAVSCWYCTHGQDFVGVSIQVSAYVPEEVEETHFPWVSFPPGAYLAIKRVLGISKNWYGHRISLSRKGEGSDTKWAVKDLGEEENADLMRWAEAHDAEFKFDYGEEWGVGEEEEEIPPVQEEPPPESPEPKEDEEGELQFLKDYVKSLEEKLDGLIQEKGKPEEEE